MIWAVDPSQALAALLEALESAGLGCTLISDRTEGIERHYANEALARIFGVDLETMRAMPPMDFLAPTERERLTKLRASLGPDQRGPLFIDTEIVRRDGSRVPVEVGLGYAWLHGSRAVFTFVRDVSAKAKMAAALSESENRFRRVAEVSPDAITIFLKHRYIYANPAALRRLGIASLDALSSVDPTALVPPERMAEVRERVARLSAGVELPPLELRIQGADGREAILEASLSLTSIDGEQAIISYTRDITDRKLLQAEVMKQDRLASVGMLAAGVAHELNNPLMSLGMQVRHLRDGADAQGFSRETRDALDQMGEATQRMQAIISDLLFMTKPVDQPQAHINVEQILTSTIALLRAGTPQCPAIHVEIEPLPHIHGYASKLGQVFLNLLRNAVQAVEGVANGEVRVRAHLVGDVVEIIIADNGPGVPATLLPRLAQPFLSTKPQGTGLGLWVSQTIVAQHGGKLDLTSVEGEGMSATVRLRQTLPTHLGTSS